MARPTLAELRTQVRDLADEPSSGGFAVDARLNNYINFGYAKLWGLLTTKFEDYFWSVQSFPLVDGQSEYDLPTDYFKTLKMWSVQAGQKYRLTRATMNDLDRLQNDVVVRRVSNAHYFYRVLGEKIFFVPEPGGGDIEHWYIRECPKLKDDEQQLDDAIRNGWEDYIITSAVVRLLSRKDKPQMRQQVRELFMDAENRVVSEAAERDVGEAHTIQDVFQRFGDAYGPR